MALRLHAVTTTDAPDGAPSLLDGIRFVRFRDLAAVVSDRPKFALDEVDPAAADAHRGIIDALFRRRSVLPTPAGIIFRTEHVVERWMELHYVALNDALEFVENRVAARVHVRRAEAHHHDAEAGSDLAEASTEILRELRRRSVASVPLTNEEITGITLSGAYLVERELWKEFERAVHDAQAANNGLAIDITGPWAPYDFVRMQFGD